MEQADVPVGRHRGQELHQRARTFGKLEAEQAFAARQRRTPAHHVADVLLGYLVVRQVGGGKALLLKRRQDLGRFTAPRDLHADEDAGRPGIGDAVIEFRHAALPDDPAKAPEAAALFRYGHREHGLARLAHLGPVGHEAHAVEVHVGARRDGHQRLAFGAFAFDVFFQSRHRQRARRLQHAAGVQEHVLDGRAHGVGVHQDHLVQILATQAEGFLAHQLDGGAVREQADLGQDDAFAHPQRLRHRAGVLGLDADDLHAGIHRLHVRAHTRRQATPANRHEDGVQGLGMLAQDLHANRALARDHVGVIECRNESQVLLLRQRLRMGEGVGVGIPGLDHGNGRAAMGAHGIHLDLGRRLRHHDDGAHAQLGRRDRDALRMVAGRGGDHAAVARGLRRVAHLVVGAAHLEGKHRLVVFPLQMDGVLQPRRQAPSGVQFGFAGDVVDPGGQDLPQVFHRRGVAGLEFRSGGGRCVGHGVLCLGRLARQRRPQKTRLLGRVAVTVAVAR
ncbi:hypothetical protein D3C71_904300 [compost metagenome]